MSRPGVVATDLLAILRARLEIQRDFRIDQLAALETMAPNGSDEVENEIVAALCRGAASALRETQQALRRLDDGSYGHCLDCTMSLHIDQLAAVPQAARCPLCERNRQLAT